MDTVYTLQGIDFEWDLDKAARHIPKHHVSFEKCCEVFLDPFVRLVDASDNDESRDAAIGYTEDSGLLFVVHLIRREDAIRIISARPATPAERKLYEDY